MGQNDADTRERLQYEGDTMPKRQTPVILLAVLLQLAASLAAAQGERPDPARWESTIAAWEAQDSTSPPPEGAVVFVGSSSVRLWDTVAEDMAPLTVIHRGFGGSWMADAVHYVDRIVTSYEPRAVVVYEGDNDVGGGGLSPAGFIEDFDIFVERIHAALPGTRIYFIAIKPSPSRWEYWSVMAEANRLVQTRAAADDRLIYLDVATPMLGEDGSLPSAGLFVDDRLHMTAAGYAIWTAAIRPVLVEYEAPFEP